MSQHTRFWNILHILKYHINLKVDRRSSKMLLTIDKWQSKTLLLAIFEQRLSILLTFSIAA